MNKLVSGVLGLTLFFLVMSVFYLVLYLQPETQFLVPLVVFSGFFIFLIAAGLVALSIFEYLKKGMGRR